MDRAFVAVLIIFTYLTQGCLQQVSEAPLPSLQEILPCVDKEAEPKTQLRRAQYLVLFNYVKANRCFHCWESITYTTQGRFNDLHHLQRLLQLWRGPVSLALHASETFYSITLNSIKWAKTCIPLVADLVTFHLFFESTIFIRPPSFEQIMEGQNSNCSEAPPWLDTNSWEKLNILKRVPYPVNVARNIARESATTYFVLSSEIDLYPSPGIIDDFLEMVQRNYDYVNETTRKVFPIPVFEITPESPFPRNRKILEYMVYYRNARLSRKYCQACQIFPDHGKWLKKQLTQGLHVFKARKRIDRHSYWEPFYIGTNQEPFYDERLFSEGKFQRTDQAYALCLQDYVFFILDNAYLIHSDGMEVQKKTKKTENVFIQRFLITDIFKTLNTLYGSRAGCRLLKGFPKNRKQENKSG